MTRIIINTEFYITTFTVAYWLVQFNSVVILGITVFLADPNWSQPRVIILIKIRHEAIAMSHYRRLDEMRWWFSRNYNDLHVYFVHIWPMQKIKQPLMTLSSEEAGSGN